MLATFILHATSQMWRPRAGARSTALSQMTTATQRSGSVLLQGTAEARAVVARLIPIQHDSLEEQEEQLPALAFLTQEQLSATLARQESTEELSLMQWTRSVGVQPPPPPDNFTEILQGQVHCTIAISMEAIGSRSRDMRIPLTVVETFRLQFFMLNVE